MSSGRPVAMPRPPQPDFICVTARTSPRLTAMGGNESLITLLSGNTPGGAGLADVNGPAVPTSSSTPNGPPSPGRKKRNLICSLHGPLLIQRNVTSLTVPSIVTGRLKSIYVSGPEETASPGC